MTMSMQQRVALLVAVVLVSLAVGGGYAFFASQRTAAPVGAVTAGSDSDAETGALLRRPHIVFRTTRSDSTYGKVAAVALRDPAGPRAVSTTSCDRVYSTGAVGLCLSAQRGVVTLQKAHLLNAQLQPRQELSARGEPSRVRISEDGRFAATTSFDTGHSYLSSSFSTRTVIYDVRKAKALYNLEDFRVIRDGKPYRNRDVNVWGVTFKRDGNGFFATMSTQRKTFLVEGSMRERTLRTLRENAECPSLSPDGTRIAYKKRDNSPDFFGWRIHILDLRTGADFPITGDRSIDDQVEWLDDTRVMYGLIRRAGYLESDVWVAAADGSGKPSVLIPEAWSPAVVRTPTD